MLFSLIVVKWLFMIFAGAIIGFTAFELASALRYAGRDVPRMPTADRGGGDGSCGLLPRATAGSWLVLLGGIVFVALWRLAELRACPPTAGRRASSAAGYRAPAPSSSSTSPFLASFAVLLVGKDGGEWWTLAFLILVIAVDTGAYASGLLFGKHPMAPQDQPEEDLGGLRRCRARRHDRRRAARAVHAAQPWWFGLIFGAVIAVHGHRRRPHRVADQARPRHQGHEHLAARATAASSTGSTRSCRAPPPRTRCSSSSARTSFAVHSRCTSRGRRWAGVRMRSAE